MAEHAALQNGHFSAAQRMSGLFLSRSKYPASECGADTHQKLPKAAIHGSSKRLTPVKRAKATA
jgi:hypothetical protein